MTPFDYTPDEARRLPYVWPRPDGTADRFGHADSTWPENGRHAAVILDHAAQIPADINARVVHVARCELQARVECARGIRPGWRDRKEQLLT